MYLAISKKNASRLLRGEEIYEILSGRAYKFVAGRVYKLSFGDDVYVKVLENYLVEWTNIPSDVWDEIDPKCDYKDYIELRCGVSTRMVYVLKLVLSNKTLFKEDVVKKAWIRGRGNIGAFVSKNTILDISGEVASSEPYCELCDEYGDWYRDFLCKKYGVSRDRLYTIKGWTNRGYTKGCFLPRRVNIVGSRVCKVSEITNAEWDLIGVGDDVNARIAVVGKDYWERDFHIKIYRYELVTNNIFEDECTED